jgi:hypothetical protein
MDATAVKQEHNTAQQSAERGVINAPPKYCSMRCSANLAAGSVLSNRHTGQTRSGNWISPFIGAQWIRRFWTSGRQTGSNPSRQLASNRLSWRNIPITLIDPVQSSVSEIACGC